MNSKFEITQYISYLNNKLKQKFKPLDNGCWEWTKEKDQWGYGVLHIYANGKRLKRISASKASWIIQNNKDVPLGMVVCHKCDNRSCVNPQHLFLGTFKDNMQDCKRKGRLSSKKISRKNPFRTYETDEERFLAKVTKVKKANGCWEWISSRDRSGYGVFLYNKKVIPAHRISWQFFIGEIPKNKIICHKCDNRLCVNPKHLFVGTHKENAVDCSKKSRNISQTNPEKIPKGEKHGNAQSSNKIILEIFKKSSNFSLNELSKIYQLRKNYIKDILTGRTWNSITGLPKYIANSKNKKKEEWLVIATKLAKNNNGKLPKGLREKGFIGLEACIKKYPFFFNHLK